MLNKYYTTYTAKAIKSVLRIHDMISDTGWSNILSRIDKKGDAGVM